MLKLQTQFVVVYLLTLTLFEIVGAVTSIDVFIVAFTMAPLMGAGYAARTFAREHGRVLNKQEYRQLLWTTGCTMYCVQLVLTAIWLLVEPNEFGLISLLLCLPFSLLQLPMLAIAYSDNLVNHHINKAE